MKGLIQLLFSGIVCFLSNISTATTTNPTTSEGSSTLPAVSVEVVELSVGKDSSSFYNAFTKSSKQNL